ncbi:hypothetical protein M3181_16875 [Mesobacillus maritimus]|uniref:hypothetical protein n=1 Tax=Mesobacillus maritimus TaxID=1643336 RepID=UPI00203B815B|nr:hypothetical protein [Mesobacillus maritimus]MCM3670639.1 hypothetical protein [Mesobacillus maritimus]
MKIFWVSMLIFLSLIMLSFGIDLLMGFELNMSIRNAISPFRVMEPVEFAVLIMLILLYFARAGYKFLQNKKQNKPNKDTS